MIKKIQWGVFLLIFILMPAAGFASDLQLKDLARKLQDSYNKVTTLQGSFSQEIYSKMNSRKKSGSGTVVLVKPGLMRWDYKAPDTQVFICDGKRILMYFAKENQMFSSPAKQYLDSDVMYSFFVGNADVLADFEIVATREEEQDIDDATSQVTLIPKKSHPQIDEISVWADNTTFLVKRLKVVDKFGSTTDITFSNIVLNKKVDEKTFVFNPPEGTEIIEQ